MAFAAACIAMMTAYTHGVLVLSLGGQVAHDLVGSSNTFVNGAVPSLFAIVSGTTGIFARPLPRPAMGVGALASASGMGLVALSVALRSVPVFLLATSTAGAGYGLLVLSALEVINVAAPVHHRPGTTLEILARLKPAFRPRRHNYGGQCAAMASKEVLWHSASAAVRGLRSRLKCLASRPLVP